MNPCYCVTPYLASKYHSELRAPMLGIGAKVAKQQLQIIIHTIRISMDVHPLERLA